jgi:hypothetical protein
MITIPDEFFKNNEFLKWFGTKECALYYFLKSYIIRESYLFNEPWYHPGYFIYINYFRNGMLVARYSQEDLAKIFKTDEKRIRERLRNLAKKGFITKIKTRKGSVDVMYYQFGTWTGEYGTDTYKESYFLNQLHDLKVQEELLLKRIKSPTGQNDLAETYFPPGQNDLP